MSMARRTYVKERQTNIDKQTRRGRELDKKRKAKLPGKRRSSSGKTYYEYRVDRTDLKWDSPKKRSKSGKKWGKIGAPHSAKRKAWMRSIRRKK